MTTIIFQPIYNHPLVVLHFPQDTERAAFARYFMAAQSRSAVPLRILDVIDRYRRSSVVDIAQEFPELVEEASADTVSARYRPLGGRK